MENQSLDKGRYYRDGNKIVTCRVVHATNKTGSISDDLIY
jgi:hypothetical protein